MSVFAQCLWFIIDQSDPELGLQGGKEAGPHEQWVSGEHWMEGGCSMFLQWPDGEVGLGLRSKGTGSRDEMCLGEDLLLGKESRLNIHIESLPPKSLTEMIAKGLFFPH